ncbi:hypothetical protein HRG_014779 [Hirsutella rhossiliensis]
MPRAASPSAASRHRLLLPPLLAGLDFCRLAARLLLALPGTPRAASHPLPPLLAGLALCRLAALTPSAVSRLRPLPPCGPFCRPAATTSFGLARGLRRLS